MRFGHYKDMNDDSNQTKYWYHLVDEYLNWACYRYKGDVHLPRAYLTIANIKERKEKLNWIATYNLMDIFNSGRNRIAQHSGYIVLKKIERQMKKLDLKDVAKSGLNVRK